MNPFEKTPLMPVIIQDRTSQQVLMLGYMNREAFDATLASDKIRFFSRSKNRLWVKGESSNNFLFWHNYAFDCDNDTLIFFVDAAGATCHTGDQSCFKTAPAKRYLSVLEDKIEYRRINRPENSYVASLVASGINKVAQKVGEEAVEVVIEALGKDDRLFKDEAADLLFHYLILLQEKGYKLQDIEKVLEDRQ